MKLGPKHMRKRTLEDEDRKPLTDARQIMLARMRIAGEENDDRKRTDLQTKAPLIGVSLRELRTAWAVGRERAVHKQLQTLEDKGREINV